MNSNPFLTLPELLFIAKKLNGLPLMPDGPGKQVLEDLKPKFRDEVNRASKGNEHPELKQAMDYLLFTANIDSYSPEERVAIGMKLLEELDQSGSGTDKIISV